MSQRPRPRICRACAVAVATVLLAAVTGAEEAPLAVSTASGEARPEPSAEIPAPVARTEAVVVVDELHGEFLAVMQEADELGYQGRYDRLRPAVLKAFDIDFMAEKSVGRHWRGASADEKAQLTDAFQRFVTANYAGRFKGFSGQRFETLGQKPSARETVIVMTRLVDPGNDDVPLDYRMMPRKGGKWKIIDIHLNGTVSEIALRRSEYSSVIQRDGVPALIEALDERIADLAAGRAEADEGI